MTRPPSATRGPPPWPHQLEAFERSLTAPGFYLSMEPRTGKSRPTIDRAVYLAQQRLIDAMLIIAEPSGAPRNWLLDELPKWMTLPYDALLWEASRANRKAFQEQAEAVIGSERFAIVLTTGSSLITENFKRFLKRFLAKRRVFAVGDELTLICKTAGAKRTKVMYAIRNRTPFRQGLDGTPTGEGPLDLYSQYAFLDPKILDFPTFSTFRARYAKMITAHNFKTGQDYPTIARDENDRPVYQNLEELQRKIAPYTYRVRFHDVFPDAGRAVYQKRYFDLTPAQALAYERLQHEHEIELKELGALTVAHVLTRWLRLQQLASGYYPASRVAAICPDCQGEGCAACEDLGVAVQNVPLERIVSFEANPRLLALKDEWAMSPGPAIVFARFNQDVDDVFRLATELNRRPVQYDGRIDSITKHRNREAFQSGDADLVVAKVSSAGRAVSFSAAESVIYYSNTFSRLQRVQSEDRPKLGTRAYGYSVVDLIAAGTIDETIVGAHQAKEDLSRLILNERGRG